MQPSEIIRRVTALRTALPTVLVAIDGPGGAGKTTLATLLSSALEASHIDVQVVHFDDFFLPSAQRPCGTSAEKSIGGDFEWLRLHDEVLAPLRRGQRARYRRYDWDQDAMAECEELSLDGVVIVEGIYSSRRELAPLYDLRVWVECPREVRLARGLERDGESARARWEHDWMPSEDRYILEHRPREYADVVVSGCRSTLDVGRQG
jgi:uridine kinase